MHDNPIIYWYLGEAGPEGAGLTTDSAVQCLSTEELRRFDQLRFPKRRDEWLLGRITAKTLLRRCVPELDGIEFRCLTIANHPQGAPYALLNGDPLPYPLSITHRAGLAAAAVTTSPGIGLGIDLEWVEERDASFYTDYFTPGESRVLTEVASGELASIGTLIWSAKEAMLKALGQGLRVDTRSVEVLRIGNISNQGWKELELMAPGMPDTLWHGYWRRVENHICTVVLIGAAGQPVLRKVDRVTGELL